MTEEELLTKAVTWVWGEYVNELDEIRSVSRKSLLELVKFVKDEVTIPEEPVGEDLEEELSKLLKECEVDAEYVHQDFLHIVARHFANWQKEHLWKPADGDDLPEIEKEVIALEGIVDPTATDCLCGYKVVFAHRPTPEGYDGKSIATGVVEHYTPKTYGEGGWNVPNIAYWLDIELPKEIEL